MATMTYPYANATPSAVGNGTATAYDYLSGTGSAGTPFSSFQAQPQFAPGYIQPQGFGPGLSPFSAQTGFGTLAPQAWYDIVSRIVSTAVPIVLSTLQTQPQLGQMQPQGFGMGFASQRF